MTEPRLTQQAQHAIAAIAHPGDRAIDATVGNGHDTAFLLDQVSPDGEVIGFDIQQSALDATRHRLRGMAAQAQATLVMDSHHHMLDHVPASWRGTVAAVMFNLGYLPGGDKAVMTQRQTTRNALDQALGLLRTGGMVSVMTYPGHAGGETEAAMVDAWQADLGAAFQVEKRMSPGPILYLITRLR